MNLITPAYIKDAKEEMKRLPSLISSKIENVFI